MIRATRGARRAIIRESSAVPVGPARPAMPVPRDKSKAATLRPRGANWVELFPESLTVASSISRPVMIFRNANGDQSLPIWVDALDAGVTLAEMSNATGATPHAVTRKLLETLGWKPVWCAFIEIRGHHQFAQVELRKGKERMSLEVRASDAMSFCVQARVKFFGTKSFIEESRTLDLDLAKFEQNLAAGIVPGFPLDDSGNIEFSTKKHPYVM